MEEGLSSLFGARVLELLIIVMVFASSIPASAEELAAQREELTLAIAVTFALSVIALYFGGNLIRAFQQRAAQPILALAEGKRPGIAAGANKRLRQLADEMDRIRQPRLFLTALFTTCFTYTSSFLTNYILLGALGVNVELPVFIAIISLGMFASAFPFTVSGFGVVEAAWRFGLMQFANMPDGDATAAGFLLHGFQIFAAAVYGLLGYLLIHISAPMPAQDAPDQEK